VRRSHESSTAGKTLRGRRRKRRYRGIWRWGYRPKLNPMFERRRQTCRVLLIEDSAFQALKACRTRKALRSHRRWLMGLPRKAELLWMDFAPRTDALRAGRQL